MFEPSINVKICQQQTGMSLSRKKILSRYKNFDPKEWVSSRGGLRPWNYVILGILLGLSKSPLIKRIHRENGTLPTKPRMELYLEITTVQFTLKGLFSINLFENWNFRALSYRDLQRFIIHSLLEEHIDKKELLFSGRPQLLVVKFPDFSSTSDIFPWLANLRN